MYKHDEKILNHTKIPCNTESIAFWCILVKLGMKIVSVNSKHYHSLPLPPPPWQPWGKSSKFGKSGPPLQIFCQMPSHQTFLGAFISINFTLFHHFQDLNNYNIYKFVWITYLLMGNMSKSYGGMMEMLGIYC